MGFFVDKKVSKIRKKNKNQKCKNIVLKQYFWRL